MVKQKDTQISSSTAPTRELKVWRRAGLQPAKEPLHEAYANLRDEPEAIGAFSKTWGLPVGDASDATTKLILGFRNTLRAAWRKDPAALNSIDRAITATVFHIKVLAGRIELQPRELWQAAYLLFTQDFQAKKLGLCGNPDCAAPYFIKKRKTQKFCEAGACVSYAQRRYANKWWREHGEDWRAVKQETSKGRK
jgi:hypothetical protein